MAYALTTATAASSSMVRIDFLALHTRTTTWASEHGIGETGVMFSQLGDSNRHVNDLMGASGNLCIVVYDLYVACSF